MGNSISAFFQNEFRANCSPYFAFVLCVYGLAAGFDRIDSRLQKIQTAEQLEAMEWINNWPTYWIAASIIGIIAGSLFYHLGGWFYNVRVRWAGGEPDREISKFIFLYSAFVPALISVFYTVCLTFFQSMPYDPFTEMRIGEWVMLAVLLAALYYSIYISYAGVRTVAKVHRWKGRIWFIFLPAFFYTCVLVLPVILMVLRPELNRIYEKIEAQQEQITDFD